MTYSSFVQADCWGSQQQGEPHSVSLLGQIACLLHCPIDTPQLWTQLLQRLTTALDCSKAQLFWSTSSVMTEACHCSEAKSETSNEASSETRRAAEGETREETITSDIQTRERLWQHLNLPSVRSTTVSGQSQVTELQEQLAELVVDGDFRLDRALLYAEANWTEAIAQIFGPCEGRHLALLPLRYEQDCIGVLMLLRPASALAWSAAEARDIESVGAQIFLAIARARVDRSFRPLTTGDRLTKLPDRVLFSQQLTDAIARSIERDVMTGVAFLDLDRFKNINDTLGHAAGDCLLQQVAERLQGCLRGSDVIARWGGDEFTLLLCDLQAPEDVTSIAERILRRLAAPFHIHGEELFITASLGIALAPYDGESEQTLLSNADAAMYQAKAKGRNNYQIYFEEINADALIQLNLETDLRKAIANEELFLCYQPQVDLRTGQWIGMEALVRWQHPTLGLVSPERFIPIAEETGLIEAIGYWVLKTACQQYRQWHQLGLFPLRLAVNLSPQQFLRSRLVRSVAEVLRATDFDPRYLELEVTESAAMQDIGAAITILKKLSHIGIQIAMDDFGTGYSSLSVLKHFPLDTIKIDRSFVRDLVESPSDAAIASTIIALAKGLNFKVLAEGIETPAQMTVLTDMGCDYAQGYWFSRPLTTEQIDRLIEQGKIQKLIQR